LSVISEKDREDLPKWMPEGTAQVLKVALPRPLDTLFDYAAPGIGDDWIGCRVAVPFGRERLVGLVVGIGPPALPAPRLRAVLERIDRQPILSAEDLALLQWLARYHHHPLGEVLADALPPAVRATERRSPEARLALAGEPPAPVRGRQLARLLALLGERGALAPAELDRELPGWRRLLARHRARGWFEWRDPEPALPVPEPPLSPSQRAARAAVLGSRGYHAFLLEGPPGSGKTELCLALAAEGVAGGRQSLVLVPEIAQVGKTLARLRALLGGGVAAYHSGLPDGERARVWQAMAEGRLAAAVGTRSAVFLPLPRAGLIVVDEEHDPAYKQPDGARFSARDFALLRARRLDIPIVLVSSTPSLETLARARRGRVRAIALEGRAPETRAAVRLADVAGRPPSGGVAPEILTAIGQALARGEQALVLRNRRGFAPTVSCQDCGRRLDCPGCTIAFTWHQSANALLCHGCGGRQGLPERCPDCGGELRPRGHGTERLEQTLRQRFSRVPVLRIDRDSAPREDILEALLAPARAGRPAIVLGTQMAAKAELLPRLTVVAALHVDAALARADFRAAERFAQLLERLRAQAASATAEVWLQTANPDHPLLQTLLSGGYAGFAARELALRREAGLPPFSHQARLCAEGPEETARRFLAGAARLAPPPEGLRIDGPLPALRERRGGLWRFELLLEASRREPLHRWLDAAMPAIRRLPRPRRLRWFLEVDPLSNDWE
jgi:primosomal protein N' (replication factor Y)